MGNYSIEVAKCVLKCIALSIYICKTNLNEVNTYIHIASYVYNPVHVHVSCSLYACFCAKEISDLQVGNHLLSTQTEVAFLRRLPDKNRIPTVQVCI